MSAPAGERDARKAATSRALGGARETAAIPHRHSALVREVHLDTLFCRFVERVGIEREKERGVASGSEKEMRSRDVVATR